MTGGYKLGGNVNIGNNPTFAPQLTGNQVGNAPANLVMGNLNVVEGNYNVAFGQSNTVSGTSDSRSNFVGGENCKIIGGTGSILFGRSGETHQSASYSVGLGYGPELESSGFGGIAIGLAKVNGLLGIAMGFGSTGSASYTIAMGQSAKATATQAIAMGTGATGSASLAIGIAGKATATKAVAIGSGSQAQTSGSIAFGRGTMGAGRLGGFRLNANGGKSTTDSYQICQSLGATTDASATKIYLASGGSTDGNLVIGTSTCVHFDVIVQGTDDTSSTVGCIYRLEGVVNRANNSSDNPAFLGSVTKTVIHEEDAGMDAAITINNTNKCLDLEVTGKAATNLNWLATWHLHQNQ